jgi:polyisoprenoid-binding protein YceI
MLNRSGRQTGLWLCLFLVLGTAPGGAQQPASQNPDSGTRWVVDLPHSQIDFRVRHLVGRVRGNFTNWYAVIITRDKQWKNGRVNVTVQTASLNTGNATRDADLRSPKFFATDSFPEMTFRGTGLAVGDTTVEIPGLLSIKGRTHPVTLKGVYRGIAEDAQSHERIAFEASAVLDRRDYGMEWNQVVGAKTLIGNEVEITIAIEAVRMN